MMAEQKLFIVYKMVVNFYRKLHNVGPPRQTSIQWVECIYYIIRFLLNQNVAVRKQWPLGTK